MNTAVAAQQQKPIPARTLEHLAGDVARLERALSEATRGSEKARGRLKSLINAGDTDAIATARAERDKWEAALPGLARALEAAREDAAAAQQRAQHEQAAKDLLVIERLADEAVRDVGASQDATVADVRGKKKARDSLNRVRAELIRCGVRAERDQLDERFERMSQLLRWAETDGKEGEAGGYETPYQLRQSGRVNLKLAAQEWRAVVLSGARRALHLDRKPE
jgi:hypothetical protein